MTSAPIQIFPLHGIPQIGGAQDIGAVIAEALASSGATLDKGDVLVVAQKIVSKAEGRVVRLDSVTPSERAENWAKDWDKDARVVELVLSESKSILRMERSVIISETHHGFVCANAGVDVSNTEEGTAVLLPKNSDASARAIRDTLRKRFETDIAVIVSDTFGRAWRDGLVNVALGVAGMEAMRDERGRPDMNGRAMEATIVAVADEIAAAAGLVMGKADAVPVAIVRGVSFESADGSGRDLLRPKERDLFR